MLLKRILILLLCGVIIAGTIDSAVHFRFFDRPLTKKQQEKFQTMIELPDNFTLAASVNSFDTVKNSLKGAQKNVRSGSYALELNIATDSKGVPYLADGPEYITEASVKLETVFKTFEDQTYLRYILDLRSEVDANVLIRMAEKYELFGRIMLTGFGYEKLNDYIVRYNNFKLCINLTADTLDYSDYDACVSFLLQCSDQGANAVSCSLEQVTEPFRKAMYRADLLKLVIRDVHSDYEMYHALSLNPHIVITDQPNLLYDMMLSQNYLDQNNSNFF